MINDRDNQRWLAELRSDEAARDVALTDLRHLLLANLEKVFRSRQDFVQQMLDDVVQESLLRILKSLDQFQNRSRFVTWATAVSIRVGMTELRKRRWKDVSLQQLVADAGHEPAANATIETEHPPIVLAMYKVIANDLTEKQRTVLLAEIKGMAQETIAQQLGSNRNAVYKLSHDARQRLKQGLEMAGFRAQDTTMRLDDN